MAYKFEDLEVWRMSLEYSDLIYQIIELLPKEEEYNPKNQLRRNSTSISLNIAEGSTSQTDAEQARFLSMALRSLLETVACRHLIHRRNYLNKRELVRDTYRSSQLSFAKLQAFCRSLLKSTFHNEQEAYSYNDKTPFLFALQRSVVCGRWSAVCRRRSYQESLLSMASSNHQ